MSKLQALIIDDHTSVRQALAKRLTNTDQIEVRATAGTLTEAMTVVQAHQPDVVILGLRVLDHNRDVTQIIQLADRLKGWGAALVILTSYAVDEDRKALLKAGARRYLLKDIDTDKLLLEINRAVTESFSYAKRPKRNFVLPDGELPNTL